jgi:glycosyltransferase involved in cell wall biosynthesis
MTKILFIAYYFPPLGSSGVQRSLKFVKYLCDFDVMPIVLTVDYHATRWPRDFSLLREIPASVKVYRAFTLDLNWLFKVIWGLRLPGLVTWMRKRWLIPDPEITWLPFAKRKITQILRHERIDLAYITGGPYSAMLLGPYLTQRHGINYIVDFRDEWTNSHARLDMALTKKSAHKDHQYERTVLEQSSGIIYAHPKYMQANFERQYPFIKNKLHAVITNGYDEADFVGIKPNITQDKFRMIYIGSFYDRRRPLVLWEALQESILEHAIDPHKISVEIYGKNTPSFVMGDYYHNETIRNIVKFYGYLSHQDSLEVLLQASVLLIFLAPGPNSLPELPGKMFECMRSQRPILAIIPERGAAAEIIGRAGTGFVFDSGDLNEVKAGLELLYHQWNNNILKIHPDEEYISQFNRKNLTQQLALFIDEVVKDIRDDNLDPIQNQD